MSDSQSASAWRFFAPQCRISTHLVSSPKVMKVIKGRRPTDQPRRERVGELALVGLEKRHRYRE